MSCRCIFLFFPRNKSWSIHIHEWAHAYKYILQASILRKKHMLFFSLLHNLQGIFTTDLGLRHFEYLSSHSSISLLTFRRKLTQVLYICIISAPSPFVLFLNQLVTNLYPHQSTKWLLLWSRTVSWSRIQWPTLSSCYSTSQNDLVQLGGLSRLPQTWFSFCFLGILLYSFPLLYLLLLLLNPNSVLSSFIFSVPSLTLGDFILSWS